MDTLDPTRPTGAAGATAPAAPPPASPPARERSRRPSWRLLAPVGGLYGVQFVVPLAFLVVMSFWIPVAGGSPEAGFTLDNYRDVLGDGFTLGIFWRTLTMGVATGLLCLALGFPVAYGIVRAPRRWRTPLLLLVLMPFLVSAVIRSFGWMVLLADNGIVTRLLRGIGLVDGGLMYTMPGLIIAMTHVFLPIMVLVLYGVLERIDPRLEEAAANLGASRPRTVAFVVFPLALPGVLAGTLLVLTLAMSSFVTPAMIAGPRLRVVATEIYDQAVNLLNWPLAAAMAILLMALILAVSALFTRVLMRIVPGGTR
ncbi:ABC transporter permease [Conexibacter arvalis]|uniref:Putative spermidine/putrescine transport system permease protein n=1 Tax=Conexibacter arvalis TaxID=912552 RepID=A0A840I8D5_9ACTN|nr:ABC transporter permease [Conexibacter arvalis]MBB4660585.1 putative spermidine/putrescine transport system permease protein [Conexibacter arvalis]